MKETPIMAIIGEDGEAVRFPKCFAIVVTSEE
jgi:hypothetical protein